MNKTDKQIELTNIRSELSELVRKASAMPAIIRNQGIQLKIDLLKNKEKELLATMSYLEIHGAEEGAKEDAARQEEANKIKSKKTLVIASSIGGVLLLSLIGGAIIYKKTRNK